VSERSVGERKPAAEETTWREIGTMGFQGANMSIEMELEVGHNLAITRHLRSDVDWVKRPRQALLRRWLDAGGVNANTLSLHHSFMCALQPSLLGDGMLQALAAKEEATPSRQQIVLAWLSARWGRDRQSLSTLERATYSTDLTVFSRLEATGEEEVEQILRCLSLMERRHRAQRRKADGPTPFETQMLKWVLAKVAPVASGAAADNNQGDHQDAKLGARAALRIGRQLCQMPVPALEAALLHGDAQASKPAALVVAIVRHGALKQDLATSLQGLGVIESATLLYFALMAKLT
jgi:hypothetical protein